MLQFVRVWMKTRAVQTRFSVYDQLVWHHQFQGALIVGFQNKIHTMSLIHRDVYIACMSSFSGASVCSWLGTIINFVFNCWCQTHTQICSYTTNTYWCDFQSLRGGGRSLRLLRGTMPRAACITGKNFLYFILNLLFALDCLSCWNRALNGLSAALICLRPGEVSYPLQTAFLTRQYFRTRSAQICSEI